MAQPLCPPFSESWVLPATWGPARPPPPSGRDCGCSPASSPRPRRPGSRAAPRAPAPERRGARSSSSSSGSSSGRLGGGQRRSASEREKLRMRTLARALHELRRFLPPSGAPGGQSLTKIETLRLAIRYIGHLSAVLGLSEESLRRRRRGDALPPPRGGCALGPDGGPALPCGPGLGAAASAGAWAPSPACAGVPAAPHDGAPRPEPSSPLLTGDVLALLETWAPCSPLEWPPA